jgi:hypothetical protein
MIWGSCRWGGSGLWSGSDAECSLNETDLADDVALCQAADLPLSDDVHCLISHDCVQCAIDGPKPLARDNTLLHETVVLLNRIIDVARSSTLASAAQSA